MILKDTMGLFVHYAFDLLYIFNSSRQHSNFEDEIPLRGEECNNATFQTPNQELRMILLNVYYIDFTELSVK